MTILIEIEKLLRKDYLIAILQAYLVGEISQYALGQWADETITNWENCVIDFEDCDTVVPVVSELATLTWADDEFDILSYDEVQQMIGTLQAHLCPPRSILWS